MRLVVKAGSVTFVDQSIGSAPGEISVRFVVPLLLRWLGVGVIVKVSTPEHSMSVSVQT